MLSHVPDEVRVQGTLIEAGEKLIHCRRRRERIRLPGLAESADRLGHLGLAPQSTEALRDIEMREYGFVVESGADCLFPKLGKNGECSLIPTTPEVHLREAVPDLVHVDWRGELSSDPERAGQSRAGFVEPAESRKRERPIGKGGEVLPRIKVCVERRERLLKVRQRALYVASLLKNRPECCSSPPGQVCLAKLNE